jgi:hypothetical protein
MKSSKDKKKKKNTKLGLGLQLLASVVELLSKPKVA